MERIEQQIYTGDAFVHTTLKTKTVTHATVERACQRFFDQYFFLPEHILLSSLEVIGLPCYDWQYFLFNLSYPIRLHTWQECSFPPLRGTILCVGKEPQYHTNLYITLEDTPLTLLEISAITPVLDTTYSLLQYLLTTVI